MARPALLAAALLALLAAACAADAAPPKCKPGCSECKALTGDELAAFQKAKAELKAQHEKIWEQKKAELQAKAAKDPALAEKLAKWEKKAAGAGKWGARDGDWTPTKCTKCATNYLLQDGWCVCPAGSGIKFPTDGTRPARGTTLECAKCDAGFASGPDAPRPPKPTWAGADGKPWAKGRPHLLGKGFGGKGGPGGKGGFHAPPICVECENGSNEARTKCL